MRMTIERLTLQNFKGIGSLELRFGGQDAEIYGANATGKTTVIDAWLWLLFDKSSDGKTDFGVKPLRGGVPVNHVETAVEAALTVDGIGHTVAKTYAEKWTKKRGFDAESFSGHETAYLIDGAPKKAGEFKAWVSALVEEGIFRLISDPLRFNSGLSWQDRRKVLFALTDLPDDQTVAAAEKYASLRDMLSKQSLEDARKSIAYQTRKLDGERKGIQPRIDELTRSIPAVDGGAVEAAKAELARLQGELAEQDRAIADAKAVAGKIAAVYADIARYEREKSEKLSIAAKMANADRNGSLKLLSSNRYARDMARRRITECMAGVDRDTARATRLDDEILELRMKWNERNADVFTAPEGMTCPTCGQDLPDELRDANVADMRAAWQRRKESDLAKITRSGTALAKERETLGTSVDDQTLARAEQEAHLAALETDIAELAPYESMPDVTPEVDTSYEDAQIAGLRQQLDAMQQGDGDGAAQQRARITAGITAAQGVVAREDQIKKANARIEELLARESEIGRQIAELERMAYLMGELVADQCALIEGSVNAMFPTVRWRLFREQINGGIEDCCDCLVGGVPYPDANRAGQINAGMEIIDVLCRHYGVRVPIFVDNREALNTLYPTDSQTVSTFVSLDPALRLTLGASKEAA